MSKTQNMNSNTSIKKQSKFSVLSKSLALMALTAVSLPALAAEGLTLNQVVTGELNANSLTDKENGYIYNLYLLQAPPQQAIQIDMVSDDIDSYLTAGSRANRNAECNDCESNDDGGSGYNSRLFYIVPEGGNVYVRAASFSEDGYGSYSLVAKALNVNQATPTIKNLPLNIPMVSTLDSQSSIDETGHYYDFYRIKGEPNEVIKVNMSSDNLDSYLAVGELEDGKFVEIDFNDDSDAYTEGNYSDSRLKVQMDESGEALIKATSYETLTIGDYQIKATKINEVTNIVANKNINTNQTKAGTISSSDPSFRDDNFFHAYRIRGSAGQRVNVLLESDDFDTKLVWGHMQNNKFVVDAENDDSENEDDGTNSRLSVILDRSGEQVLMVTSYDAEATGDYTLTTSTN